MLYISRTPSYIYDGHIFHIQNRGGIYTKILHKSIEQLKNMLTHYQRVFLYRFDLHPKSYGQNNTIISQFISKLKYWVKTQYNIQKLGFIWVREHNPPTPTQHYHLAIMLDGSKVDTPYRIAKQLKTLWTGTVGYANNPYYRIQRNDYSSVQAAIYRISYLAKVKTKIAKNPTANAFSCSRIKPHAFKIAFDFEGIL